MAAAWVEERQCFCWWAWFAVACELIAPRMTHTEICAELVGAGDVGVIQRPPLSWQDAFAAAAADRLACCHFRCQLLAELLMPISVATSGGDAAACVGTTFTGST